LIKNEVSIAAFFYHYFEKIKYLTYFGYGANTQKP
jgi:hypothetical protein